MSGSSQVLPGEALEPLVLALDIGTSSARAIVYDSLGRSIKGWETQRPLTLHTADDGEAVFDANDLLFSVSAAVDGILEAVGPGTSRLRAVACDTFWHSLMGVDASGNGVTPIYTWADTRSAAASDQLRRELSEDRVHARTGCVFHTSYWPAKLRWLGDTEPDATRRVATWMSFAEYLYLKLFGQKAVSISMASGTGLFDQNQCCWDAELLGAVKLTPEELSPLHEYSDAMSRLVSPYKGRWPCLAEIPWFLALGDGACNNIGSGGTSQEWVVVMIGTSGALRVTRKAKEVDIPNGLWTYRVDSRRFVQGGSFSNGGNLFAWLEHVLALEALPALEAELSAMHPDAHGLTVLPFLAGERSPVWDARLRAALVGMGLHTNATEVARACLEAVAYRFRLVYNILRSVMPAPAGIIGSGTALISSPAWLQIMADVLGESVTVSDASEATSRGAALLALEALGATSDAGVAMSGAGAKYAPVKEHTEIYLAAIRRQESLRKAVTAIMHG